MKHAGIEFQKMTAVIMT